jgi:hypothetical protein
MMSKIPHNNLAAAAIVPMVQQLGNSGEVHQIKAAQSIATGLLTGLRMELKEKHKHPICRYCGKRHG